VTLSQAGAGQHQIVELAELDAPVRRRLAELGIRPGQLVTVLQRGLLSGLVLAVGGLRLALDLATARSITVVEAPTRCAADQ